MAAFVALGAALAACSKPAKAPNDDVWADPCASSIAERASWIDFTKHADAVVTAKVAELLPDGSAHAVVLQQWAGYPVSRDFQLTFSPSDERPDVGSRWVLFLVRRTDGVDAFEKLPPTVGRKDLELVGDDVGGHDVGWVREQVQQASHVGPMISAELARIGHGEPPTAPFRVEYRVADGAGASRYLLADGVVVKCGPGGTQDHRPLASTDVREFANDLRATEFWRTPKLHGTGASMRDAEAAIEVAGVVLTFDESAIDQAPASPVLRVVEGELAAPPASHDVFTIERR